MKYLFFLSIWLIIALFSCNNQDSTQYAFKELYSRRTNNFTDNTYISDSISTFPLSYDIIKQSIEDKDTLLAKTIIENGKIRKINPQIVANYFPSYTRVISIDTFHAITPILPSFNECEQQVLRQLDSVSKIMISFDSDVDNLQYKELKKIEDSLFDSECFLSYQKKQKMSKKRLIIFWPVYEYNNRILICYSYYTSLTDNFLFVEVI